MPFSLLLAAPQSFNRYETLHDRLNYYLRGKVNAELHVITLKHWTQEIKAYATKYGHTVKVHVRDFAMDGPKTTQVIYSKIIEHVDGAVIFWDEEAINEKLLIKMCQERPLKHYVETFESLKQELERTKPERKAARKKITVPLTEASKRRYKDAHKKWYERQYPEAIKDGFYSGPKMPVINSGSAAAGMIVNFLVWEGWNATVVSAAGRQLPSGKWIPGTTKPGSQDVFSTIKGRSVKWEVKHSADYASDKQDEMKERERAAGGISEFIYTKNFDYFFEVYDKIINNEI